MKRDFGGLILDIWGTSCGKMSPKYHVMEVTDEA